MIRNRDLKTGLRGPSPSAKASVCCLLIAVGGAVTTVASLTYLEAEPPSPFLSKGPAMLTSEPYGPYRIIYRKNAQPNFSLVASSAPLAGQQPVAGPFGLNTVSVAAFDATNNALRINASLSPGGIRTPHDADQVFTSIFDPVNNAVRVNCVLGCGGGGGSFAPAGDLSGGATTQTVIGLEGRPLATQAPTANQVLSWTGTAWTPTTPTGGAGAGNCTSSQFVTAINLGSTPTCSQPSFSILTGTATPAQLPTATGSAPGAVQLAGDLGGTAAAPTVSKLQGNPVASTAPAANQVLAWNGSVWTPQTAPTGGVQVAQDLGGTFAAPKVIGLQGYPVVSTVPASSQVLTWTGSAWTPQAPAAGGAQIAGDLGGTLTTPKVVALQGNPVSSTAPSGGQCLIFTSGSWTPGSCGTGTGALLAPAAAQVMQPTAGSNITPLAIAPASGATQTADLFDVWKDSALTTKAFWVDASGNLNFSGNNATYGSSGQTSQSYLRLYGSTTSGNLAPPYLDLEKTDGTVHSFLAPSTSSSGLVCVSSSVPGGDCAAGTTLMANPMTTAGDLIYGGAPNSLGVAAPARLPIGANGQCLTAASGALAWGACGAGGGGGTVTSVGLAVPTGYTVTNSPVTGAGTLTLTTPITSTGDLMVGNGTNSSTRLAIGSSGQCLTSNGTTAVWGACGAGGGGTVTSVGLTTPSWLSVSGGPITTTGTLAVTAATGQTSHQVLGTFGGTSVTLGSLTGADLPSPSATSLGGVQSLAAAAHQWVNSISTAGVPGTSQPSFADLSGTVQLSQTPLTGGGDIMYSNGTSLMRLAGNTTGTQCLQEDPTGTPSWASCGTLTGSSAVSSVFGRSGAITAQAGDYAFNLIGGATAAASLSNGTYPWTLNWTSPAATTFANTTVATSTASQSSPIVALAGQYWNGSASASDTWTIQDSVANGTNAIPTLVFGHTGSTGAPRLSLPGSSVLLLGNSAQLSASGFLSGQSASNAITVQGGADTTNTNGPGLLTLRGMNITGGANAGMVGGAVSLQGGDNASTAATGTTTAGNLTVRPGEVTASGAGATAVNGQLQVIQPFSKGTTYTAGNLQCFSADNTVSDCTSTGAAEQNAIGVAVAANGNAAPVVTHGTVLVNLDASTTASAGAYACLSATVAAKVTVGSTACTAGQAVGILTKGISTATSGRVLLARW